MFELSVLVRIVLSRCDFLFVLVFTERASEHASLVLWFRASEFVFV